MAYDEGLADRIRRALEGRPDVEERHMFGGVAFMLRDHVCCGVVQSSLMVRLDPDGSDHLLHRPNVRPMDATGRPMRGFLFVDGDSLSSEDSLLEWVDRAVAYAESMPDEGMDEDDDESMPIETDAEEEPYEVPARSSSMNRAAGGGGASRSGGMTSAPQKAAPQKAAKKPAKKAAKKKTAKKAAPKKAAKKKVARKKTAKKSARKKAARKAPARRKKTTARKGAKKSARRTSGARRKKAARRPARSKRTARKKK
jgi:TfoX/Sxy family transcriptional regulator of competence genes